MQLIELTGEQQGVLVADKARIHHPILDVGDTGIWDLAPECREKQLRIAFYDRFVVQIDDILPDLELVVVKGIFQFEAPVVFVIAGDDVYFLEIVAQPVEILVAQEMPVAKVGNVTGKDEYVGRRYKAVFEEPSPVGLEFYMQVGCVLNIHG